MNKKGHRVTAQNIPGVLDLDVVASIYNLRHPDERVSRQTVWNVLRSAESKLRNLLREEYGHEHSE